MHPPKDQVAAITTDALRSGVERAYLRSTTTLPADIVAAMEHAMAEETSPVCRRSLEVLLANARKARAENSVVCQDTGIPEFHVRIGTRATFESDPERVLREVVAKISRSHPLIPHAVHPITRVNSGDNTGIRMPMIDYSLEPGADFVEVTVYPIAGVCVDAPVKHVVGVDAIEEFVVSTIKRAGAGCPPFIVGVGIGGSFDYAAKLAKIATLRPWRRRHSDPDIEHLEERWKRAVNMLGMGTMNLGGSVTALSVNVELAHSHTACNPVAVRAQCWAMRRATVRIHPNEMIEEIDTHEW